MLKYAKKRDFEGHCSWKKNFGIFLANFFLENREKIFKKFFFSVFSFENAESRINSRRLRSLYFFPRFEFCVWWKNKKKCSKDRKILFRSLLEFFGWFFKKKIFFSFFLLKNLTKFQMKKKNSNEWFLRVLSTRQSPDNRIPADKTWKSHMALQIPFQSSKKRFWERVQEIYSITISIPGTKA